MVARTFDLTSAYRQVALSSEGKRFSCIKVFDPNTGSMQLFRSLVLSFGAIRSVHAFLRLARAIWWIGVVRCRILWTSFYDDFISFNKPALIKCIETTIVSLFKLLGWAFAQEADKCSPFDNLCEAFGVAFDLHNSCRGSASVKNTESRVLELCNDLQEIINGGTLSSKHAQRMRGRMQFAETQMFGRTGRRCLRVLSDFAKGHKQKLQAKDVFFLRLFKDSRSCCKAMCPEKSNHFAARTLSSLRMHATSVRMKFGRVVWVESCVIMECRNSSLCRLTAMVAMLWVKFRRNRSSLKQRRLQQC